MKTKIIKTHIELLGRKAEDKVTGFKGVITSISFDLYGCIQAVVSPGVKEEDNKIERGQWFDVVRLSILEKSAMSIPDFEKGYVAEGNKGAAPKPQVGV